MPTTAFEFGDRQRRPLRSVAKTALPARTRIGSGVALASAGGSGRWKDNPHHWQTLILLVPLLHNPDKHGYRKPVPKAMIQKTVNEIRSMFSGYTLTRAKGWYWDEEKSIGVPDDIVRFEVDGIFTGSDLRALHQWKRKLRRRFKQDYIYIRLVGSGVAI
ncbi:MAG: hypothetical protein ABSG60_11665 [Terracidiphilus sp.]|jgi:hypothetical protein